MSLTAAVRGELARALPASPQERRAMLAGMVRTGGSLHRRGTDDGGRLRVELSSRSGGVARAAFTLVDVAVGEAGDRAAGSRPELAVHEAGGVRTAPTYTVAIEGEAARVVAERTGLLDEEGRPQAGPPLLPSEPERHAFVRGAMLARGTLNAPGQPAHLEIAVPTEPVAEALADAVGALVGRPPLIDRVGDRWRVVVKSGAAIGELLGSIGATSAYLVWQEAGVRGQVRRAANRLANADAANVRRSVEAAMAQARSVERAVEAIGWARIDDDLRQVALARLTNPEASLAELGALCHPPVGKSAVHRRLARLSAIAEQATSDDRG